MQQGKSHLISMILKRQLQCFGEEADRVIFCSSLDEKRLGDEDKTYFSPIQTTGQKLKLWLFLLTGYLAGSYRV